MKTLLITLIISMFSISGSIEAQETTSRVLDKSTIQIEGTSNVHDWTSDVEQINAKISFNAEVLQAENPSSPVESLSLTIPVAKIESGKGAMNRKMHGALKEDKHPNITFELSGSELAEGDISDSKFELTVKGKLTVAGVTKDVTIPVTANLADGNTYQFSGNYKINMKDYKVDPPTAMFGAVRAGEMVTVVFDIFVVNN